MANKPSPAPSIPSAQLIAQGMARRNAGEVPLRSIRHESLFIERLILNRPTRQ